MILRVGTTMENSNISEIKKILKEDKGDRVRAIKYLMNAEKFGLKEAKDYVDDILNEMGDFA